MFKFDSSTDNARRKLNDDSNFEQQSHFNYDNIISYFEEVNSDLDNLKPYEFLAACWELTKFMRELSSALSMAFSDITEKVTIWRKILKDNYPNANNMIEVMEEEMKLSIHELNGENNSKKGHKKGTPYYKYEAGTRTLLRLSWFLDFMRHTFWNLTDDTMSFKKGMKQAYDAVLAPHHPWLVRKAAAVALGFAPSKKEAVLKCLFGIFNTKLGSEDDNSEVRAKVDYLAKQMDKCWEYIHNWFEKRNLLDLP